jgi:hypothetical protein
MKSLYEKLMLNSSSLIIFVSIIPIIAGLYYKKYLKRRNIGLFLNFLCFFIFIQLIERLYIYIGTYHTKLIMPFVNWAKVEDTNFFRIFYYLTSAYFLGKLYYNILKKDPIAPFIKWTAIIGSIAMIINYCFIEGYKVVGYFNPNFDTLFCMFMSGYYIWHLIKTDYQLSISKNSYFWISLGLFLLCSISLIFRFLGDDIYKNDYILYLQALIGKNIIDMFAQILYAIGFHYAYYTRYLHQETEH